MRHPAAHEVQDVVAGRQLLSIQIREALAEVFVYVLDQPWLLVELTVRPCILLSALRSGQDRFWTGRRHRASE
jgi:hypothetical protein